MIERVAPLTDKQTTNKLDVVRVSQLRISNKAVVFVVPEEISKTSRKEAVFVYYLGIDIGKRSHVASLLNQDGKAVFKAFSFTNTTDGGESLLAKLSDLPVAEIEIGMEATGHYWLSVFSFLVEKGYIVHVINPIQTDGWRKGMEIRKRKTDIIDSVLIADLIRYGNFLESSLMDENVMSLRNLSRFRHYLVQEIGDLKRKTICVLDQVFPEYETVFSDIFGKTSKEILLNFSAPADYENITAESLEKSIENVAFKKLAAKKIKQISSLAANSFGINFCIDSFTLQLQMLISQIKFIENQLAELEVQMSNILDKLNSPILSIPGVGAVIGATILGEIGDISRFSTPAKLAAFAGIDATVSQSGEYQSTQNKMSKRGSPYLRKALFQAAFVASNCDPTLRAFYLKKRSEGKHHLIAIGAVSRKMCNIIHAILTKSESYIEQPPSNIS